MTGDCFLISDAKEGEGLARTFEPGEGGAKDYSMEENRANARLITAAPDLLEACKAARELITSSNKIDFDDVYVPILDAAIAKATGGKA